MSSDELLWAMDSPPSNAFQKEFIEDAILLGIPYAIIGGYSDAPKDPLDSSGVKKISPPYLPNPPSDKDYFFANSYVVRETVSYVVHETISYVVHETIPGAHGATPPEPSFTQEPGSHTILQEVESTTNEDARDRSTKYHRAARMGPRQDPLSASIQSLPPKLRRHSASHTKYPCRVCPRTCNASISRGRDRRAHELCKHRKCYLCESGDGGYLQFASVKRALDHYKAVHGNLKRSKTTNANK